MAILVTGGTGFVGLHVIAALAQAGEPLVSWSTRGNPAPDAERFLGSAAARVTWVRGDILDLDGLRAAVRTHGVHGIIHGAAVTAIGDSERDKAYQAVRVNVGGTAAALEAGRLEGVSRFLYISSATVYGAGNPGVPLLEETPCAPRGIYAITKHAAEEIVLRYRSLFGLQAAVLRISAPYGPLEQATAGRDLLSPLYTWCHAARCGQRVVIHKDLERDFTYVRDIANGIRLAWEAPTLQSPVYNLAAGRNVKFSDVLGALAELRPGFTYEITPGGGGFFEESLRGPLAIGLAAGELGFAPRVGLREGLSEYLAWLDEHKD